MMKTIPALLGAAVLMVGGLGFAKGSSDKEAKRSQEACTKFEKFQTSVQNAQNIGPSSTVGELKSASAQVEKNFKEFEKSASKAAKPQVENVKKSVKELRADAKKIPNSATLSEAHARLQPDIQQVRMASNQLMTKLNCGMGGGGQQGMEQQGMEQQGQTPQTGWQQQPSQGSMQQGAGGSSQQGSMGSQQGQGSSDQGSMNQGSQSGQDQSGQGSSY